MPWKLILTVLVVALPGGSLILLGIAGWKAIRAVRERRSEARPAATPVLSLAERNA